MWSPFLAAFFRMTGLCRRCRITVPLLMINGRYDLGSPFETSQLPMFRFLGTPQKDKRHVLFDTGHVPPRNAIVKETLDWLDRYLGPVK